MNSLVWELALRFRKSKKRSGFNAFIASSSTVGIGLGCFVLIVLLSVMNGFEKELKERLLATVPHGELTAVAPTGLEDWQEIKAQFSQDPRVTHIQPFIKATALLQRGKRNKAVHLTGIDVAEASQKNALKIAPENAWQAFEQEPNALLLGKSVLQHLGLSVGDKVQVLLPKPSAELKLSAPVSLWLTVVGEITMGGDLDSFLAYMHIDLAAATLGVTQGASGLSMHFDDPFIASSKTRELGYLLPQHVYISDWTRTHGYLYQDIQLVRTVVYIALTLVIAVASFNIVSSLVMSVREKQTEIAMLKTMGTTSGTIASVFVVQGIVNGIFGTLIGAVVGVVFALNLSNIAAFIEHLFGFKVLSGDVYFIDFLPSQLHWQDVWLTVGIALVLSVLATLYPAIKASKVEPAKVLGH
ncbi:lipoprotein-releasing ABC transporter permease subunit [Alteromonas sp. a30]|uniref:lipoprotein-releasing ABC transporter permease subunit n=1 Tax=Alteromonas sp. a30 TaxID=2730917 RepID=UPI002281AF50|nr:lipoprotein-releasing ABC transporter permease subunit [Alteromonas sp. a30]MCY7294192.1 lipoprotein-releasing ABC transporter permease subunit [Alteromonas sp. a30]